MTSPVHINSTQQFQSGHFAADNSIQSFLHRPFDVLTARLIALTTYITYKNRDDEKSISLIYTVMLFIGLIDYYPYMLRWDRNVLSS